MGNDTAAHHFGEVIRMRRLGAGMSQETLAAEADCHPTYISLLENGRRNPSLDKMLRLGRALNCPAWKLVREAESRLAR